MIKLYQINSETLKKIRPQSPFEYTSKNKKFFDINQHLDSYDHVANIDCIDLNEAFQIGNIGPEDKIERLKQMHSISVGDVLEMGGYKFAVDGMGFHKI